MKLFYIFLVTVLFLAFQPPVKPTSADVAFQVVIPIPQNEIADPQAFLERLIKILKDANVGTAASFTGIETGREYANFAGKKIQPKLKAILAMPALVVLTQAHIKWDAKRWNGPLPTPTPEVEEPINVIPEPEVEEPIEPEPMEPEPVEPEVNESVEPEVSEPEEPENNTPEVMVMEPLARPANPLVTNILNYKVVINEKVVYDNKPNPLVTAILEAQAAANPIKPEEPKEPEEPEKKEPEKNEPEEKEPEIIVPTQKPTKLSAEQLFVLKKRLMANVRSPSRNVVRMETKDRAGVQSRYIPNRHVLPIDKTKYHTNQENERILRALVRKCPKILRVETIGHSVRGDTIWGMRVNKNAQGPSVPGKPKLLLVANLHGDEVVGRELMLWTLEYICNTYTIYEHKVGHGSDGNPSMMNELIDSVDLWVIPSANPDGYAVMTHENARQIDLNRNFPDRINGQPNQIQPETKSLMKFMRHHRFAASISFHGGSNVVTYPWDSNQMDQNGQYSKSVDDELFRNLAHSYADYNPQMQASKEFDGGVVNGAEWYVLHGGMQDWVYAQQGSLQITADISSVKWPVSSSLANHWPANRVSIFSWISATRCGAWGIIQDINGIPIRGAYVIFTQKQSDGDGNPEEQSVTLPAVHVNPYHGDYYRILMPGVYSMRIMAAGYESISSSSDFTLLDSSDKTTYHRQDFILHLS